MRITTDRSLPSTGPGCLRMPTSDNAFADTLTVTIAATDDDPATERAGGSHPPELSAATYRLFAAIDLERGDTKHAELHLSRVPDAREAGLPAEPTGLLSDVGRWDYTEAAAALPETGRFDTATGQGERSFIPYNTRSKDHADDANDGGTADPCVPETSPSAPAAAAVARDSQTARGDLARLAAATYEQQTASTRLEDGIAALLDALPS